MSSELAETLPGARNGLTMNSKSGRRPDDQELWLKTLP